MKPRLVVWFSCGAASAVTAKLCLTKLYDEYEIAIARCVVANEHPDNDRFATDCEKWFGVPIINLRSQFYRDCWDVWEVRRFLVSSSGAPCTGVMKRTPRKDFEHEWYPDVQAYGYTVEERKRVAIFRQNNPQIDLLTPLIDAHLRKADCFAIIQKAGIRLPTMYHLGFNNNNCIGCVKGGMGYWNRIRIHFPQVFSRMAKLERELGHAILRTKDIPIYLDELPPDAGKHKELEIDCSLFCYAASDEMEVQHA